MEKQNGYDDIYGKCKKHMHSYVLIKLTNGETVDGIITGVDHENAYLAVPKRENEMVKGDFNNHRQYGSSYGYGHHGPHGSGGYGHSPGYGGYYPGYGGYYPGYGQSGGPFRRLILPLTAVAALSLLPWY